MADVAVVGSLNEDTTVRVAHLPQPGETVIGQGHFTDTGGKGGNQAVAAARLGRSVGMVGKVGTDRAGARLVHALREAGVGTDWVTRTDSAPSGVASITVDEAGENQIVVSPGANALLRPADVEAAAALLAAASVTMLQLEVRSDAVATAAGLSRGIVLLNPAPARLLEPYLLADVGVVIPNRTELAVIAGAAEPATVDEAVDMARSLGLEATVVVTLGSDGAVLVSMGDALHVPAMPVGVVDPTGAGDAFCAGIADALVGGASMPEAVRWAVRCGAAATLRWGAQAAMPDRGAVEALGTAGG
jgi:ribokinase